MNGESERMNRVLIYHNSKKKYGIIINVEEIQAMPYKQIDEGVNVTIYDRNGKTIAVIMLRGLKQLSTLITLLGTPDYPYIYIEDGEVKKWTMELKEAKEEKEKESKGGSQ